ncbi:MAG: hypothetical protein M0013_11265, partial [Actinomycetota bacterium]|nr:hypothetical protein [Actinomycetota bacterium]
MASRGWWLGAGGWGLAAGGWGLASRGWWLVAGGWWLVAGGRLGAMELVVARNPDPDSSLPYLLLVP